LVAAVAVVSFAFGVQPAGAVELPVAGPFVGTAPFELGAGCSFVRQSMNGTAELSTLGSSTVELNFCVTSSPFVIEPGGSFSIVGVEGSLSGDVPSGSLNFNTFPAGFHLDLIVAVGTGAFAGATGNLAVDGTFEFSAVNAQVTGAIDVPSPTPTSKADCKQGGWRDLADDDGVPFRNQGQCIAFVVHNRAEDTTYVFGGPFEADLVITGGAPGCVVTGDFAFDTTVVGVGPATVTEAICVELIPPPGGTGPLSGTFLLTATGGTLEGTFVGTGESPAPGNSAHHDITISSGTGIFAGATGTATLDATIVVGLQFTGNLSGSVDVPT
jgi:hypothetical protein